MKNFSDYEILPQHADLVVKAQRLRGASGRPRCAYGFFFDGDSSASRRRAVSVPDIDLAEVITLIEATPDETSGKLCYLFVPIV